MPRPLKQKTDEREYAKRVRNMRLTIAGTFIVMAAIGVFQIRSNIKRLQFPEASDSSQKQWQEAREAWQSLLKRSAQISQEASKPAAEEVIRDAALKNLSEQLKNQTVSDPNKVSPAEDTSIEEQKAESRKTLPASE